MSLAVLYIHLACKSFIIIFVCIATVTHVGGGHAGYGTPVDDPPYRPTDSKADAIDSKL